MTAAFECRSLTAGHQRVPAVRGVDITLAEGTVLAVLGPNGAGKTTLLSTIAGLLPSLQGEVVVDGTPVPKGNAVRAGRAGIVLVSDDRALFTGLSVRDNLVVASRRGAARPEDLLDLFPALTKRWRTTAGMLSGGEQQMLAVARALIQKPRVLLIDEMSMGLAPVIVEELLPTVRAIATDTGAVVVLVEQHVALALSIADEAIVLVHGGVGLQGPAAVLRDSPELVEAAYLGTDLADAR